LYTCISTPQQLGQSREELRAADAGFHVEVHRPDGDHATGPLAMEEAPLRPGERVTVLSFGASRP
jgi:hypothetical protein